MNTNHTSEPWVSDESGLIRDKAGNLICQTYDNVDDGLNYVLGEEPSYYNTKLIEHAPALLRKAKEIVSRGYLDFELINIIRAAEGKPNE